MYTLATIENAKKLVLSKFPNLNMDAMSIEDVVNLAQTLDPSFTPGKVLYACEKADEALGNGVTEALKVAVKEDRRISFGRDSQSFISFKESDLKENQDAIFLAKCMKLLMVEYQKTSVQAARILFAGASKNYAVYVSWCGGWGKFISRATKFTYTSDNLTGREFAEKKILSFIAGETVRNAHNLMNIKEILSSMSL